MNGSSIPTQKRASSKGFYLLFMNRDASSRLCITLILQCPDLFDIGVHVKLPFQS